MLLRPATFGALVVMSVGCQALLSLDAEPGPDASVASGGTDASAEAVASDASDASDASAPDASVDAGAYCPPGGAMTEASCPGQFWRGRCYFVAMPPGADIVTQSEAKDHCAEAGAYLATITCPAEWAEVLEPLKDLGQNAWLGATRSFPDQPPTWRYTNEPWTFTNPTYPVMEDAGTGCLVTNKVGQWGIVACTSDNAFAMCEIGPLVEQ